MTFVDLRKKKKFKLVDKICEKNKTTVKSLMKVSIKRRTSTF